MKTDLIKASGGIVFRSGRNGWEVLTVHRPRYDDWSLPKGKPEPGEDPSDTAHREVWEETGLATQSLGVVGHTEYSDHAGRPKRVTYYGMRPLRDDQSHQFHPNEEVDQIKWIDISQAGEFLSYSHDASLVQELDYSSLTRTGHIWLVRHAKAGSRRNWEGPDRDRPLTPRGVRQAHALVHQLEHLPVGRILSSPYLRCQQTVQPLAEKLGLEVEIAPSLAEGSSLSEMVGMVDRMIENNPVLCSHGDMIPAWLSHRGIALPEEAEPSESYPIGKASVWEIQLKAGSPVAAEYSAPPALCEDC